MVCLDSQTIGIDDKAEHILTIWNRRQIRIGAPLSLHQIAKGLVLGPMLFLTPAAFDQNLE